MCASWSLKHGVLQLLKQIRILEENWVNLWYIQMIYPNFCLGIDFLCFYFMNYELVWEIIQWL